MESAALVYVNGIRHELPDVQPEVTLLRFLRGLGYKGPKLGCGEGGCGACTVMVSGLGRDGAVEHRAVNACLRPLCAVDGCHVTTTEGIGSVRAGLHPVQRRIAEANGSQCGFCTPGMVMSLYAMLRQSSPGAPSAEEIDECFDGNLCRCTGYRPLVDAARTFAAPAAEGEGGCCGGSRGVCCRATAGDEVEEDTVLRCTCSQVTAAPSYDSSAEPIFPPELARTPPRALRIEGASGVTWHRPASLQGVLELLAESPPGKIVSGNTEVGIETKFKDSRFPRLVDTSLAGELQELAVEEGGVRLGAGAPLSSVLAFCKRVAADGGFEARGVEAISQMLRFFASTQIRNVASLGGNIATASPISDINPLLLALGARLTVASAARGSVVRDMDGFFQGYRKVNLAPDELIVSVFVPWTRRYEFVTPFKQARRREDDISIVCAAMRVNLEPSDGAWVVESSSLVFGGMAPITKAAAVGALTGRVWDEALLPHVYSRLAEDLPLPDNVPGGQAQYRRTLCSSFFFKFWVRTCSQLPAGEGGPSISADTLAAGDSYVLRPKPQTRGSQSYQEAAGGLNHATLEPSQEPRAGLGATGMHESAYLHASGEAQYTDDIDAPPGTLNVALIQSTRPHARIVSIDDAAVRATEGVVAVLYARDMQGENAISPAGKNAIPDEYILAPEVVTTVGQPIGIVVAESRSLAWACAKRVKVTYEDLPAVCSIQEAIAAGSYHDAPFEIRDGDVEAALAASEVVVEGEVDVGGQEHFYLEPNVSLCVPGEDDTMHVTSSTQNPTQAQEMVAQVLAVPAHNIVSRVKRLGGGFGGKESRSAYITVCSAIAAHHLKRPCRMVLDRDVDMAITGSRHAFYARYRAGATREGQLTALRVEMYNNAGHSLDRSRGVMCRGLFHADNSYKWPALLAIGHCCKTNTSSNTAFRGFGAPQAMLITETAMDHLCRELRLSPRLVRERNLYREGERKHFGQVMERCHLRTAWSQLVASADVEAREAAVAEFNASSRFVKRGLAVVPTSFGIAFTLPFMNQGGSLVHVYTDGSVAVSHGGCEMGQGINAKCITIAARCFGISDDRVRIMETSTDKVPNGSPTAASHGTDLFGMATLEACEQIRARLEPYYRAMPEASFAEIANAAYFDRVSLSAQGFYAVDHCSYDWRKECEDNAERGQPYNYFTLGVACSEVELDTLTGDMRVLRSDVLMDLGNPINAQIDIGQIEGAFVQGLGWCTMEELIWGDDAHPFVPKGHLFTKGPGTYKIPSFDDVPVDLRVTLLRDVPNPLAVHSSKAVGEPPLFLASSAFLAAKEAIYAARGSEEYFQLDSPASSERLRMACVDDHVSASASASGAGSVAVARPS